MAFKTRIAAVICAVLTCGLAGCGSVGPMVGDVLPEAVGGLPKDTPPRPGAPGYEEYRRRIETPKAARGEPSGDTAAAEEPAAPETPPRR